jgi:hypothetical protein
MVVSCSLAIAAAYSLELTKGEVAKFTATAEQHVGVTSGGMDQAISVMAMPGVAMMVDFNPVSPARRGRRFGESAVVRGSSTMYAIAAVGDGEDHGSW